MSDVFEFNNCGPTQLPRLHRQCVIKFISECVISLNEMCYTICANQEVRFRLYRMNFVALALVSGHCIVTFNNDVDKNQYRYVETVHTPDGCASLIVQDGFADIVLNH